MRRQSFAASLERAIVATTRPAPRFSVPLQRCRLGYSQRDETHPVVTSSQSVIRHPVITGLGIVSPIGIGAARFWKNLQQGRSGVALLTAFDTAKVAPECRLGAEILDFTPTDWMEPRVARASGRFSQFAVAAARLAFEDSAVGRAAIPSDQITVSFGTSMDGLADILLPQFQAHLSGEELQYWTAREYPAHAATAHVAREIGSTGPWVTMSTACAAGVDSIAWAANSIRNGTARVAIAGGTETPLSPVPLESFRRFGLLSRWKGDPAEASRPFDRLRSGLVIGEGAAAVVLEEEASARARGAPIYARILASSSTSEGPASNQIEMSGESLARCIAQTLRDGDRHASELDYISAHGNAIPRHDIAETAGIKRALGAQAYSVPVSSIKSMCGQAFAASSAMQVVASCLAIRDGILPPTINYSQRDPLCDLDYVPNTSRYARVRIALVHARSIGGSHTTMLLEAPTP
jgi:3-oxoacyl-[acyl-carrier-protein] synthase II